MFGLWRRIGWQPSSAAGVLGDDVIETSIFGRVCTVYPAEFEYFAPQTVDEVLELLTCRRAPRFWQEDRASSR